MIYNAYYNIMHVIFYQKFKNIHNQNTTVINYFLIYYDMYFYIILYIIYIIKKIIIKLWNCKIILLI